MTLRENDLLAHIYAATAGGASGSVVIPPGDDMGGVRVGEQLVLVTVDQIADGVHFDAAATPVALVARKCLTRNLSDVAAMAAQPLAAVAAISFPRNMAAVGELPAEKYLRQLFDEMKRVADHYACPLIGGDTSFWKGPMIVTVTVLAEPAGVQPVLRSGAEAGDIICVTGRLGGAWPRDDAADPTAFQSHLTFEPRLSLARHLAKRVKLHAMMDLSDGLAADLPRLCERSGVAAEINVTAIPLREEAGAAAAITGRPAWQHGIGDGEDYELLFTLSAAEAAKLPGVSDGVPITPIGRVLRADASTPTSRVWLVHEDGHRAPMQQGGWEHVGDART